MMRQFVRTVSPRSVRNYLWLARRYGIRLAWRRFSRSLRLAFGGQLVEVRLPSGRFVVDIRDEGVGQVIYDLRKYEPHETQVLEQIIRPGMKFIDVGANIGYFTLLASRLVGPTGAILAVEPDSYNFALLKRNATRNHLGNVQLLRAALGARAGHLWLRRSETNYGDHRLTTDQSQVGNERIEVKTFDQVVTELGRGQPDVVKIDTQGFEGHVIQGMNGFFSSGHTAAVLTEYWPTGIRQQGCDPQAFLRTFADHGFSATVLARDGTQFSVQVSEVDRHLPPVGDDPSGCYLNVLFRRN